MLVPSFEVVAACARQGGRWREVAGRKRRRRRRKTRLVAETSHPQSSGTSAVKWHIRSQVERKQLILRPPPFAVVLFSDASPPLPSPPPGAVQAEYFCRVQIAGRTLFLNNTVGNLGGARDPRAHTGGR